LHPDAFAIKTTGRLIYFEGADMAMISLKERIAEAGVDCFHARGFSGCSVGDIAAAAHAPKGSFYNHFKSKEHLAAESVARFLRAAHLDALRDASSPPLTRLRKYFESLAAGLEGLEFERGCLMGLFAAEAREEFPLLRVALVDSYAAFTAAVAVLLAEARREGALSSVYDDAHLAAFIIDAWEGAILRAKVEKKRQPFDTFFAIVFGALLR
jgi:TetR/AcrR family transcriptional regulator, transcriptional repressor for nem operon